MEFLVCFLSAYESSTNMEEYLSVKEMSERTKVRRRSFPCVPACMIGDQDERKQDL